MCCLLKNNPLCDVYFSQHQGKIPPKPTRGKIKESTEPLKMTNDDIKPSDELNIPDIVSRVDITQIADTFISELSDEDWKVSIQNVFLHKFVHIF